MISLANKRRLCIDSSNDKISITRQCNLINIPRSTYYYKPVDADELTLHLLRLIDEEYTRHPFLGTRRMRVYLRELGCQVNRKRIQRLYKLLGVEAVYPKKNTSKASTEHKIYPYLLRGLSIDYSNHVWSTDITYIRLSQGFVYLMAIIDWYSRYVLNWSISTSLEAGFCVDTLQDTLATGKCHIFNTDQGSQFTANAFVDCLLNHDIKVSMDGRGRALDNIFIERLWRSVKYECIYLREFNTVREVNNALQEYFEYYNYQRFHQSLDYKTPASIYLGGGK